MSQINYSISIDLSGDKDSMAVLVRKDIEELKKILK